MRRALPLEIAAACLLSAVVAAEILVTYSRLPARELYHVSGSGLSGGAGRVLVFANFPVALVAIVVLAFTADWMSNRALTAAALVGITLCAAVFWPGVVHEADLDAKPVNAFAAIGVVIALALTALASRQGVKWSGRQPGDRIRVAAAAGALLVGVPWLAADLGFYTIGERVHHGHHHGMDGVLLLLCAAVLSRVVPSLRRRWLRVGSGAYLALMTVYAIGNIANDAWIEQVVHRGWTNWAIPNVLHPGLTVAWGLIVLGAALLYGASVWWARRPQREPAALTPVAGV